MKKSIIKFSRYLFILGLAACTSPEHRQSTSDTSVAAKETATAISSHKNELCFLSTQGTNHQDTTAVHLLIDNTTVSGEMYWFPAEKDRRNGTLSGTKTGDTMSLVWSFMQEGMQDTIRLEFKLRGNILTQKPSIYNATSGRELTDDKSGYTIILKSVDCATLRFKK